MGAIHHPSPPTSSPRGTGPASVGVRAVPAFARPAFARLAGQRPQPAVEDSDAPATAAART